MPFLVLAHMSEENVLPSSHVISGEWFSLPSGFKFVRFAAGCHDSRHSVDRLIIFSLNVQRWQGR